MKKIYSLLLIAASVLGLTTSCSDVPMPYDIANGFGSAGSTPSFGKVLPYKSAALSTGWTPNAISENEPWSQGANYTQATGYSDWNGDGTKENAAVESYLVSPAFNTKCESGQVSFSFDYTIRYENKVSNWQDNHKIFISKDYDGINFDEATWEQIAWTPVASKTNDWTLYTSGNIAVPEDYVNRDSIYLAFYFKAPADASTTWELQSFLIQEGEGSGDIDEPTTPGTGDSSKDAPYTVAQAKAASGNAYVKGYIVGYVSDKSLTESAKFEAATATTTNILIADNPDETDPNNTFPVQLPTGAIRSGLDMSAHPDYYKKEVTLYGSLEKYFSVTGMKSTSWAKIGETEIGNDPSAVVELVGTPAGDGTKDNPYNVAAVNKLYMDNAYDSSKEYYVKGIISEVVGFTEKYGSINYYIKDKDVDNKFYVYSGIGLNKDKFTSADDLKVGDEVVICGTFTVYNNTFEFQYNNYLISINGSTESAGGSDEGDKGEDKPTGSSEGVSIDASAKTVTLTNSAVEAGTATATIDISTLNYANNDAVETVTLSDGATIKFEKGTNSNAPKYFDATKGVRVYGNNIITIEGKTSIASVLFECDAPYSSNGKTINAVGCPTATVSFSGNTATYTNVNDGSNAQIRIQKITVTYAK